jgi:hypothetical protein
LHSNSFISRFLAFALETIYDGGDKIFSARCSGAGNVGAWSDGVASSEAFLWQFQ